MGNYCCTGRAKEYCYETPGSIEGNKEKDIIDQLDKSTISQNNKSNSFISNRNPRSINIYDENAFYDYLLLSLDNNEILKTAESENFTEQCLNQFTIKFHTGKKNSNTKKYLSTIQKQNCIIKSFYIDNGCQMDPDYIVDKKLGIVLINEDIKKIQRNLVKHIFKEIAYRFMRGKSLLSLPLPVNIYEPRTILQRLADSFSHAPSFLERGGESKDEMEQFRLVIAFVISTLYKNISQRKPYNPMSGETLQLFIGDNQFYAETINVLPLTIAYLVVGKNYRMEGCTPLVAAQTLNTIKGYQTGYNKINFLSNNHSITFTPPVMYINVSSMIYIGISDWEKRIFIFTILSYCK